MKNFDLRTRHWKLRSLDDRSFPSVKITHWQPKIDGKKAWINSKLCLLWAEFPSVWVSHSLWVSHTNALDLQNLWPAIPTRYGRRRELEHGFFTIVDNRFASKLPGET